MPIQLLVLKALSPLVFNAPSDTMAAAHGPAVGGRGVEQPLPSTIAGMLAAEARRRGLCNPVDCTMKNYASAPNIPNDFHNIHVCLEKLLGRDYKLYTGLAVPSENTSTILVYTEKGYMKPNSLPELLREGTEALKPLHGAYTGIALSPATKTVRRSMLYTIEQLVPKGFYYAAMVVANNNLSLPVVIRLGAEARVGHPKLSTMKTEPWRLLLGDTQNPECRKWLLNLASPALLEETPWSQETPIMLDRDKAETLFRMLLEEAGHNSKGIALEGINVPKTVPGLEVIAPGWCTPRGSPRYPMLYVPAGATFQVEASSSDIINIVKKGLGTNTRQGWGTVAAACIE